MRRPPPPVLLSAAAALMIAATPVMAQQTQSSSPQQPVPRQGGPETPGGGDSVVRSENVPGGLAPAEPAGAIDTPEQQAGQELRESQIGADVDRLTGTADTVTMQDPTVAPEEGASAVPQAGPGQVRVPDPAIPPGQAVGGDTPSGMGMTVQGRQGEPGQAGPQGGQPSAGGSNRPDPVPLPDVPEAVVESLERQGVTDIEVPPTVGQPPRADGASQGGQGANPQPAGQAGGEDVAIPQGNLRPEATDPDREPYPGQAPAARRPTTDPSVMAGGVLGREVRDFEGQSVGEITDLLIDPGTGGVSHAVIEADGRRIAVPWRELSATRLDRELIVTIPQRDLMRDPAYAYGTEAEAAVRGGAAER